MTRRSILILVAAAVTVAMAWASPIHAEKLVTQPKAGSPGQWRLIGTTEANHSADHDAIIVKGPFDNFRRLKFKVTDAPLNMQHMVVTYDNGAPDRIEVRQNIAQGGEPGDRPSRCR